MFRRCVLGTPRGISSVPGAAPKRPPSEHAFFLEASPKNTVGTLRRNTIGTLNQCPEPAFRDQLSPRPSFLPECQRIRTPIPPPDMISGDGAPQRGPDPKRRSEFQKPKRNPLKTKAGVQIQRPFSIPCPKDPDFRKNRYVY